MTGFRHALVAKRRGSRSLSSIVRMNIVSYNLRLGGKASRRLQKSLTSQP